MATYNRENFEQIASAIGVEVEEIAACAPLFESAARWHRLNSASPKRAAPSVMRRKLDNIAKRARKLLSSLGIADLDEAIDGPGDHQILDAMMLAEDDDETPLINATQRIARLVEIIEAAVAAAELTRRTEQSDVEVAKVGKLTVEEGNPGHLAINEWIAAMMSLYQLISGNKPRTSVGAPNRPDEGKAGGPLIRFLAAAGRPLQLEFSDEAWRSRVRTVLKSASLQD